ncbi:MAG: hypothetical protein KDH94_06030 [Coxiellaceae bacterium]|nr:hypothetical protein [Coxiellaceae bacterium]
MRYLGEPGARIGYGGQWGKAYVGVNVHGEFFKARQYSSTNFVNSGQVPNRYELKYLTQSGRMGLQYGFQLTPGYLLAPHVLFYGVIGVNRTKLQVDQDAYLHLNGGVNFVNLHESLSKNVYGFDLGFGLAVKVKHHFGIRLQYDTVRYGSGYVEKAGYAPDDSITSVTAYTIYYTKMRPKTEAISLGLTYYLES